MQTTINQSLHGAPTPPQSESRLQSRCVIHFKNTYRHLAPLFYCNKNDGKKSRIAASLDTALGVTPGIPDTFLALPRAPYHGLYIEFKTLTGTLSPAQKHIIPLLEAQGYRVEIVRSEAQFQALVTNYLADAAIPL